MSNAKKQLPGRVCIHVIVNSPEGIEESSEIKRISPWYYVELIGCAKPEKCLAELKKIPDYQTRPELPTTDPQEPSRDSESEKTLALLFSATDRIANALEADARKLGSLGQQEVFPEHRGRELREKIVSGMVGWAVRRMGADLEQYLDEGVKNFLDHFILNHAHFDPGGRIHYERFWEPFERTNFYIPLKPGRRIVHHSLWPKAWEIYKDALPVLKQIKEKGRKAYLMAIKENFHGVPDDEAEKMWRMKKDSDRAAEYARWKLKLPVGVEALKEYFQVFHQHYGYFNFIANNLARQK
jgi:hypothetical protein